MYKPFNPNPKGKRIGDCTIRAISMATGQTWDDVHIGLFLTCYQDKDMQNANASWGRYLREHGFRRYVIPDDCPDCYDYTVEDFCRDHPEGLFVLATGTHVVCVKDGDWYDSWDSGSEVPQYYFVKED